MKRLDRARRGADMSPMLRLLPRSLRRAATCVAALAALAGCSANPTPAPPAPKPVVVAPKVTPTPKPWVDPRHPVMLGIDVLEAEGFGPIKGKTVGLLTHPAGVDMHGVSTIDVLLHAPGVHLAALYAPEHGVRGEYPAGMNIPDHVDARTGLPVHSLYNGIVYDGIGTGKPTKASLKGIDVMVIDLQDVGVRSYTFVSAMRMCMEGCFENGVEVVVLDRPNPLGGLKVDGPPLDPQLVSYVGTFRVPYVHGLTIGELARMAKQAPDILKLPDAVRTNSKLTVIPMRGWRRSMRWPETGLTWVPTSQGVPTYSAAEGLAMVGLGTQIGGFKSGVGTDYPFRGISYHGVRVEVLERELKALNLPGIGFRRVSVPDSKTGKSDLGLYVEITDWDEWRPTELGIYLIKLACVYDPRTFAMATKPELSVFRKCLGSTAFYNDVVAHGSKVDVAAYLKDWQARNAVYQQLSRKYWLYY
jgi:uncharacterized protein YbbC (DUF1343 family)